MTNKVSMSNEQLADLVLQGAKLRQLAALEGVSYQAISSRVRKVLGPRRNRYTNQYDGMSCLVAGCDRPARSKRLCLLHYNRMVRNGDPGPPGLIQRTPRRCKLCGVEWADKGQRNPIHRCWSCNQIDPDQRLRSVAANHATLELRRRHKAEWSSLNREFLAKLKEGVK